MTVLIHMAVFAYGVIFRDEKYSLTLLWTASKKLFSPFDANRTVFNFRGSIKDIFVAIRFASEKLFHPCI